jgi:hypothetical protein
MIKNNTQMGNLKSHKFTNPNRNIEGTLKIIMPSKHIITVEKSIAK